MAKNLEAPSPDTDHWWQYDQAEFFSTAHLYAGANVTSPKPTTLFEPSESCGLALSVDLPLVFLTYSKMHQLPLFPLGNTAAGAVFHFLVSVDRLCFSPVFRYAPLYISEPLLLCLPREWH